MQRADATRRLEELLRRVAAGDGRYLRSITEVDVFGSYARGAKTVRDIDLIVEYEPDEQLWREILRRALYGMNEMTPFNQELRGTQRIFEIHYGRERLEAEMPGLRPVLLWRRGESLDIALGRLHAIRERKRVRPFVREHVLPEIMGLEGYIPRPARYEVERLVNDGVVTLQRVELPDAEPSSRLMRRLIERRWAGTEAMRRSALAAAAYLQTQGIRRLGNRTQGWPQFLNKTRGAALALGGASLIEAPGHFRRESAQLWLAVVNPSRSKPLVGVLLRRIEDRAP